MSAPALRAMHLDSERFGERVHLFLSHSCDSKTSVFPQAQETCWRLNEGRGN
jgi:hypothetical protein